MTDLKQAQTQFVELMADLFQLDEAQALWEKKKLVLETRYIVTLDRIEQLAGREWLWSRVIGSTPDGKADARWCPVPSPSS